MLRYIFLVPKLDICLQFADVFPLIYDVIHALEKVNLGGGGGLLIFVPWSLGPLSSIKDLFILSKLTLYFIYSSHDCQGYFCN
jgi:hypothetical protein